MGNLSSANSNQHKTLIDSVEMFIVNPWVGADSKLKVHVDEVTSFKGVLPAKRILTPGEDFISTKPNNLSGMTMILKKLGKKMDDFSYMDLVGCRVKVKWTGNAAGIWPGTIVDYEPMLKNHWIKYDNEDTVTLESHFPQDFISTKNWSFIN